MSIINYLPLSIWRTNAHARAENVRTINRPMFASGMVADIRNEGLFIVHGKLKTESR